MRRLWFLLLLVPLASAGSEADPEVADATGDVEGGNALFPFAGIDVAAAWVEAENATTLTFVVVVAGDPTPDTGTTHSFEIGAAWEGGARISGADLGEEASPTGGATAIDVGSDRLTFTVDRGSISAGTGVPIAFVVMTSGASTGNLVTASDRAPDEGLGRNYTLGSLAFDVDSDGDGISDADELVAGTNPMSADTDGDGVDDRAEIADGTDPLDPDSDGDGMDDGAEKAAGSDPGAKDTDGDGVEDGDEQVAGTDPTAADSDGDGLTDGEERDLGTLPLTRDSDADGVEDGDEVAAGTDPLLAEVADDDGVPMWMFIVFGVALVLLILLLIVWAMRGQREKEPEAPVEETTQEARPPTSPGAPGTAHLLRDPAYLREGITDEELERARRIFEEREARRR